MAKVTFEISDFSWGNDNFFKANLWSYGLRKFLAILECDCDRGTNYLDLIAERLEFSNDNAEISIVELNDFFAYEALDYLDDYFFSDDDDEDDDEREKPSDKILKYYNDNADYRLEFFERK